MAWHSEEHDIKVTLDDHLTFHKWGEDFLRFKNVKKPGHRHYPLEKYAPQPLSKIRRVAPQARLTPIEASAEYELMRTLPPETHAGELLIADYVVEQPSLMVFDQMPTSRYLEVGDGCRATDFNYDDKPYHPSDVPIKQLTTVPVVRIHSPYSVSANPYYMDEGLHNIDIQFGLDSNLNVLNCWLKAVEDVVESYGLETQRNGNKIFFKHNDRWVKFHSAEMARGVLACYVNIDCAYNKAYDFYRPDVEKDVRNMFAYGLKQGNPAIDHSIVDQIIERFSVLRELPIEVRPYAGIEVVNWQTVQELHTDSDWIIHGQRKDASWFYKEPEDGFEYDFKLNSKPKSNKFLFELEHSGLEFHYQPALTAEELGQGKYRAPDVVGSYAVYHPTKMHRKYQVGKIGHIYRPIARDAKGLSYFCNLEIKDDVMSITVPQEFLDKAVYPVIIDPTVGYTTIGASSFTLNSGNTTPAYCALTAQLGSAFKMTDLVVAMSIATPSTTAKLTLVIYDNTGARIDYGPNAQYTTVQIKQWYAYTAQVGATLSAINYDIGAYGVYSAASAYTSILIYFDTATNAGGTNSGATTYTTPPNATEPALTVNSDKFSLYVSDAGSVKTLSTTGAGF